jgi:DNA invertase Pin-like site-specific DNA recombinase
VSSQGQIDGDGYDRQLDLINRYATEHYIEIVYVYKDAYTGTEDDRPEYMEMLEAMMANGVKIVVVECLDRLARDFMIQSLLLAKLDAEQLVLYNAMTGENVTEAMREDPMRRAMVQIQGVFAELDKNMTVAKLRRARQRKKAKTGQCEGRKVFGALEGEGPARDRLLALANDGEGPKAIADTLNAEGVQTRSGKPWTRGAVFNTLKRIRARAQ